MLYDTTELDCYAENDITFLTYNETSTQVRAEELPKINTEDPLEIWTQGNLLSPLPLIRIPLIPPLNPQPVLHLLPCSKDYKVSCRFSKRNSLFSSFDCTFNYLTN